LQNVNPFLEAQSLQKTAHATCSGISFIKFLTLSRSVETVSATVRSGNGPYISKKGAGCFFNYPYKK